MKQLRHTKYEVKDLGYEKEEHSFAKVSQNGDDGKSHSCEVAKRVTHKNSSRIPKRSKALVTSFNVLTNLQKLYCISPVMIKQSQIDRRKWCDEIYRKLMSIFKLA